MAKKMNPGASQGSVLALYPISGFLPWWLEPQVMGRYHRLEIMLPMQNTPGGASGQRTQIHPSDQPVLTHCVAGRASYPSQPAGRASGLASTTGNGAPAVENRMAPNKTALVEQAKLPQDLSRSDAGAPAAGPLPVGDSELHVGAIRSTYVPPEPLPQKPSSRHRPECRLAPPGGRLARRQGVSRCRYRASWQSGVVSLAERS